MSAVILSLAVVLGADPRVWTDTTGKFRIEAALVERNSKEVVLRKSDGSQVTVPVARLSPADQQHLDQLGTIRFGKETTLRRRYGVTLTVDGGWATGVVGTIPIPTDWPEQSVKVLAENKTPNVKKIRYRTFDGVKQMQVDVPNLRAGEAAEATVIVELTRRELLGPEDTTGLVLPRRDRQVQPFLAPSPKIESDHAALKAKASELFDSSLAPWQQVEVLQKFAHGHIIPQEGEQRTALEALRNRRGDCEAYTALFVALCRANGIPARSVWITRHAYPEFCLADAAGKLHWFPAEQRGPRGFGSVGGDRAIMQKGDNFKVPEFPQAQHYASGSIKAVNSAPGSTPKMAIIDEAITAETPGTQRP